MNKVEHEKEYEAPAIVYEGKITTRAGSVPTSDPNDAIDPARLFGQG